ncbi:MAG TPA: hypothetical protein VMV33_03380 [Rhodocyclaceae bacterium]|nr:hypothetical protein [Rhodocyclaceae bacterium]
MNETSPTDLAPSTAPCTSLRRWLARLADAARLAVMRSRVPFEHRLAAKTDPSARIDFLAERA